MRVLILEGKILLIIKDFLNKKLNYIDYYKEIA